MTPSTRFVCNHRLLLQLLLLLLLPTKVRSWGLGVLAGLDEEAVDGGCDLEGSLGVGPFGHVVVEPKGPQVVAMVDTLEEEAMVTPVQVGVLAEEPPLLVDLGDDKG